MKPEYPFSAGICNFIGVLVAIFGIMMLISAMFYKGSNLELEFGFASLFSSVLWFVIANAIWFLAKIEFNTRKPPQTFKVRTPELPTRESVKSE